MTNQPELVSTYYLALENGIEIIPRQYKSEFLFYYNRSNSLWGKLKRWLGKVFHKG